MKTHPLIRRLRLARPAFLAASAALLLPSVARAGGLTVRITADGSTAVFSIGTTAFVFTNDSSLKGVSLSATTPSITSLGAFTGNFINPYVLSDNGSVVAGNVYTGTGSNAFRAVGGTITNLGTLGTGTYSYANYLSADGSVVVGQSYTSTASTAYHAFRWTTTSSTMTDLGTLGTGTYSYPYAMTPDGTVIVGEADTILHNNSHAFRWTSTSSTMTDLGVLGTGTYSSAYFVSTNGNVVVGESDTLPDDQTQAFRWTPTGGMVNLNNRGGTATYSYPYAMNKAGSVVVGYFETDVSQHAFRWTEATGMQTIQEWLTDAGVTVAPSFAPEYATGVSEDGSVVLGNLGSAANYAPFIARGGEAPVAITIAELMEGMASTANSLSLATDAGWTMLNGAHGHPLSRRAPEGQSTAWAAGDLGEDNNGSRDGDLSVGEVGFGRNFGKLQVNLALGKTNATQHTPVAGKTELDGTYLVADLIAPLSNRAIWITLTGFYQFNSLDVRRGYLNAGTPDASTASFDAHTVGGALRADWENALTLRGIAFTPYVKGTIAQTSTPTFTETGGGLPAVIAGRKDLASEVSVGVNSAYDLRANLRLVGTLEGVHRFQDTSASTTADFGPGIGSVTTPGQRQRQDWARGTLGFEYDTGRGLFSISANATTVGQAASLWIATSYQVHF